MSLFSELKNRNVFRVAAAYIVGAWLLIQVVETIFPAFGFGDAAVRVVVIVLAIGLVPVLVFSWLFELTPEGLKRESAVDHSQPLAAAAVKRLDRAIIVILTLALGFFAFDKFVLDPVRDTEREKSTAERVRTETLVESYGENSIAVLPFRNMSDDAENEYFSDGMAEELLNLLARIPRLRVISQSSSFSFKGKDFTIPQVAEQLNVGFVLEGSVRKSGNKVRITAQLIEARSDTHLWSGTYDRALDDVFAIQDEISTAIVDALKGELKLDIGAAPKATGTANTEAHDAVLRGAYALAQRIPGSKTRARIEFEQAVALDPNYALAHAQLALSLFLGGCGGMLDAQCAAKAESHAEKSLDLAPGLAEAHTAKAWQSDLENDVEGARMHFRRAIEINPNDARVYVWMATWGLMTSLDEAYAAREMAVRLDPISPLSNYSYIRALLAQNRLEEADRQIEKYAMIDPRFAIALRGQRASLGGNWANYILAYLEAAKGGAEDLTYSWALEEEMMWHLAAIGLQEEALLLAGHENIGALIWLGDPQGALSLAQESDAANSPDPWQRLVVSFALAQVGGYAEARPVLEKSWHSFVPRMPGWELKPISTYHAQALIAVLRDAGEEAEARQVLIEFRDWIRRNREAGNVLTSREMSVDYFEGTVRYLGGERDAGLALMSRAAEDGYWIMPPAPFQQSMYQDPGFAAILERQKARQAREREKVLSVVCTNNPYADVWQPTETTCEEYFSAGRG